METTPLFELQVDHITSAYLKDSARWAKFLAIMGFIFCGLFVIFAFVAGSLLSSLGSLASAPGMGPMAFLGGGFIAGLYLVIALIYFFPCLFLFRFASKMQLALRNNDQEAFIYSLKNMRALYRFLGILLIVGIGIWLLSILFVLVFFGIRPGATI
jgi:uncharacterized membrane protein YjgN (DUF898 family)